MHSGNLVFAQLMEFAPWYTFRRLVRKYRGDFNVRTFSCLDQFLAMAFAQLTYRESLRDIEACLRAQSSKLYHMGLRGSEAQLVDVIANGKGPMPGFKSSLSKDEIDALVNHVHQLAKTK